MITKRNKLNVVYTTTPGKLSESDCTHKMTPRQFVEGVRELQRIAGGNVSVFKAAYYRGDEIQWDDIVMLVDHGITPYKGGRTERVDLRFTPEEIDLLDTQRGEMSRSDYISKMLKHEHHALMINDLEFHCDPDKGWKTNWGGYSYVVNYDSDVFTVWTTNTAQRNGGTVKAIYANRREVEQALDHIDTEWYRVVEGGGVWVTDDYDNDDE